jgi:hypothetical protein
MYINSPGGMVTSGLAIYDTMQFVRPQVSTMCLGQAYWPAAAEDRRGAGARFFYDGRDGQGFRLSRQGNRSSAGDTTACSRVLNGDTSNTRPGNAHESFSGNSMVRTGSSDRRC